MRLRKSGVLFLIAVGLVFIATIVSCEIGMGAAVDVSAPTIEISYPPKNAIIRDTFIAAGKCEDDMGIDWVKVTLINTETNQSYGPYEAAVDKESGAWTASINQKDESQATSVFNSYKQWQIPDGSYVINAEAQDKDGKKSPIASSPVSIDNTAPVLIVSKPLAVGSEAATQYGRSFMLAGDIAEEHETSKIILTYKNVPTGQENSIELNDTASMSSSNPLVVAKYYGSGTAMNEEKTALRNTYLSLYGNVDEIDKTNNVDKTYYCAFLLEDNARLYVDPSDAGSGSGNQTSEYYILSKEVSDLFGNTYSLDVAKLMQIMNGKSSYSETQISEITAVLSRPGNRASSTDITATASSKFTLNPNNSPVWAIDGYDVAGTEASIIEDDPNEEDDVFKRIHYTAGNILTLSIKAGRDNIYIKPNTVIAKLYRLRKDGSTYVRESAEGWPKTIVAEGEWTDPASDSATMQIALDISEHELTNGTYYEFDVTGIDRNNVSLEAENGQYVFYLSANGAAPLIEFTDGLNRSWKKGDDIKNSFDITGVITSSTPMHIQNDKVKIEGFSVKDNNDPARNPSITYTYNSLSNGTGESSTKYPFKITLTPESAGGKLVDSEQSKYTYTISVKAIDDADISSNKVLTLYVDNKNPSLNIASISPVAADRNGIITIKGTASDNESGLASLSYSVYSGNTVSGDPVTGFNNRAIVASNSWEESFNTTALTTTGEGDYTIQIIAADKVGNKTTRSETIHVKQASDTPEISLSNASKTVTAAQINAENNLFDSSLNNTLYGSVTDDDGVGDVKIYKKRPSEPASAYQEITNKQVTKNGKVATFSCVMPSDQGLFDIKVEAIDTLKETTLHTGSITFPIAVNDSAPEFINVTPESSESNYVKGTLSVSGRIKDATGAVTISAAHTKPAGATGNPASGITQPAASALNTEDGAVWSDTITLPSTSGKYSVTYTASNAYQQTSTHKISYSVDVDAPEISNIKINNTDFTGWWKNGNVPLSATVTDAGSGVQKVWYSLNGTDAYSEAKELVQSGTTWSANISINDAASQTIYIHAEDKLENAPTPSSVTVKIDNNPPALAQKWFAKADGAPAALTADSKVYVNSTQSVTVYGNYSDVPSGVKALEFTLGGATVSPVVSYSTAVLPESFTTDNLSWTGSLTASNRTTVKSWKAVFSASVLIEALTDAELVVKGCDEAGNTVTAEGLSITKDKDNPDIAGITIKNVKAGDTSATDVYKVSDTTYYLRNQTDGAITISGISTDNKALASTSLEVQGLLANGSSAGNSYKLPPASTTDSSWSFSGLNMTDWPATVTGARVTIKAFDKSGNCLTKEISLVFDETKPVLDDYIYDDTSYTFRGTAVQKYSGIKIGQGTYSETSYGQLKQIAFTLYYKEEGSSFDEIEYQFLPADKTTAGQSFEWNDNPSDDRITGTLKVERHATNQYGYSDYVYYDGESPAHRGLKVTGSINGFEDTAGLNRKNLLLLRATDKCGNKSEVMLLKVLVDKSAPVISFDDYSGSKVNGNILTNKKSTITLTGTAKDIDAGIKALRINLKDTTGTTKIFDTKNEITGLTTTTTVLATADMDGDASTPAEPVKVKLTNKYGSLTYSGYKVEPTGTGAATAAPDCSLNSAASFVKWELEIDPTKAGYTSYGENATPSFYIDAEDWAEHSGTGNEANNKKIGTLLVDVTAPEVTITSPDPATATSKPLNGKQTIKGTVTDSHDLVKVSLYISNAATAPTTEAAWGAAKAEIVKSDTVPVSKLYSFEFENININTYADATTGLGKAHILVVAEDIAGNKNAFTGSTAYDINCDKDRPVVTISDETLKNGTNAISSASPLMFTNNAIDFTLEDDDGIEEAEYKITKASGTVLQNWTAIDLSSSDGGKITSKITLPVDDSGKPVQGEMNIEFRIKDKENTTAFTSSAATTLEKIKLQDTHGNVYGTTTTGYTIPILYLRVDTEDPIITFEGITKISEAGAGTEITSGYANVVLGGTTTSAKIRFSAKDDGTGVDATTAQVKVELDDHDITGSPFAATPDTSTPDPDDFIVTIPCSTGDGTLTITVLAGDKAGKSNSDKKTFVLDNTKPEITITAPSETTYQSGATTGTGEFDEVCTLYYAISPIAPVKNASGVITNSPANYTAATAFSYDFVGNSGSAVSLGTGLNEKCGYVCPTDTKMKLFYIYFDGDTEASSSTVIHSALMNDRIIDMGITTLDAIKRADNPFDKIVKLYMYIKAVDSAGNYSENVRTILVDPLGQRPVASIGYPSEDNLTLGGPITLMGTATGANPVSKVWVEVSQNGGTSYGTPVEAELRGSSWNLTINANGEYDPANADDTKNIKIRVHAVDSTNANSGYEYRTILIDKDTPVVDQNLKLVKWVAGKNGSNGSGVSVSTDANGKGVVSLAANSYSALRNYTDKMSLKGKWFLIGKVSDTNGLKSIKIDGTEVVTAAGGSYSNATTGTYVAPIDTSNNYYFCIPIGTETDSYVGEQHVDFIATENKTGTAKSASKRFIVKVDNKAPELVTTGDDYKISANIKNENGFYTFSSVANENKVNGVEQTGVERIAFYFTRDTASDERLYDVMIQNDKTGNKLELTSVEKTDGLYWKKKTGVTVSGAAIILSAADVNIHTGGLAKVNGSIYTISTISTDGKTITLSEAPGTATEAYFAMANVIDNPVEEGTGKHKMTTEYGWGYFEDTDNTAYDDGDNMIEKLKENKSNDGSAYYWSASVNSRNLDDGPVVLHYVVFDKAGNFTTEHTVECTVKNNPPRIAGLKIGTDQNGDKLVTEADEEFINTYHIAVNSVSALNETVTYPAQISDTTPSSVITVKGRTVIQPEILGGNGALKYTWTVAKRNAADNGWDSGYYSVTDAVQFGVGTKSDDSAYATVDGVAGSELATITLPVSRFVCLYNGKTIEDALNQKFTFSIQDSTPARKTSVNSTDPQTATVSVIMNVDLLDTEPATNYIIPFYWNSLKKNSVYSTKKTPASITDLEGHIELPEDLNKAKKADGTNAFTATGTGVNSLNPKVSGRIKIEGIARDNSLLKTLTATVNGTSLTLATYDYTATGYLKPANKTLAGDGWQVSLQKATYAEYKAAGYITEVPTGKEDTDTISYTSQKYGHVVHWTLILDTAKFLGTIPVKTGMVIKVEAADRGSPAADTITADDSSVGYASNNFADNGVTNPGQTGGTLGNTGYTCKYTVDVVPYISGIKTYLSSKSGKDDTSEFDRTALGHYPVSANETAYFYGFNLAKGASVTDSANNTRYLGAADSSSFEGFTVYPTTSDLAGNTKANVSTFTSGEVTVTVSGVPSLNNKNFNESQGSYGAAVPELSNYGKKATLTTFTNFYNRRPNSSTNYTLTDDVVLDIWQLNKEAAKPNPSGRVDEPIMRINPATGIIGFAFHSGPMHYAMPKGNNNSYIGGGRNNKDEGMEGINDGDYHAGNGFNYDENGNAYAIECGGDESGDNAPYYVHMVDANGTSEQKAIDRNLEGGLVLRYKLKSSSFAATDHGTNGKNLYLAYYNSYNSEIRFRSGNSKNDWGLFQYYDGGTTTRKNSQVIACKENMAGYNNGGDDTVSNEPLGKADEYVCIDVIKGTTKDNDIVVLVWYDGTDLWYTYNKTPLKYEWRDNGGVAEDKRGLNHRYWETPTKIFSGVGEYCQIKVDKKKRIHIAAHNSEKGILKYAYLESYNSTTVNTYDVDTKDNTGGHMTMDVALDDNEESVPYISYTGSNHPKLAYLVNTDRGNGAVSDKFTGNWEVTYIPTDSNVIDMNYKKRNNLDSRVNVGVWKDGNGKLKNSINKTSSATDDSGTCWGNGTKNPVVGYQTAFDDANDRIETAQMK